MDLGGAMALVVMLGLATAAIIMGVNIYNEVNPLKHKTDEAAANIEVTMNKRLQLTNRLVEVAQRYANHEQTIQLRVSGDRSGIGWNRPSSFGQSVQTINLVTALAAGFPDLKADQTYNRLMTELSALESDIQNAYQSYNSHAQIYNTKCASFPVLLVASLFGFNSVPYLDPSMWYTGSRPRARIAGT